MSMLKSKCLMMLNPSKCFMTLKPKILKLRCLKTLKCRCLKKICVHRNWRVSDSSNFVATLHSTSIKSNRQHVSVSFCQHVKCRSVMISVCVCVRIPIGMHLTGVSYYYVSMSLCKHVKLSGYLRISVCVCVSVYECVNIWMYLHVERWYSASKCVSVSFSNHVSVWLFQLLYYVSSMSA